MHFTVAPEVFEHFPGMMIVAAVARRIDNTERRPAIEAEWRAAWDAAGETGGTAQEHPRVVPWREMWKANGISSKQFPSSIQALLRRAMKGGEPFEINPLVDFYNAVSLRHVVPAGAFELDRLLAPVELRITRTGDTFHSLDEEAPVPLPSGEVAYASGATVLTRHFVWRQSVEGLIRPETRDVLLLSEVAGQVGRDVAEAVADDFRTGIRAHFGLSIESAILSAERTSASWCVSAQE